MKHSKFVGWAIAVSSLVLASCGGGGGGGGSGSGGNTPAANDPPATPSNGISVTIDKPELRFASLTGAFNGQQSISFSMSGSLDAGTYYAAAEPDGNAVFDTSVADSTPTSVKVNLTTRSANADGTITFKLCKDKGCGAVVWSRAIPYHVRNYTLDASEIKLAGYQGANTTTVRQITPGATASDFRITASTNSGGNWLSGKIDANGALSVSVAGAGLYLGNYSGTISVWSALGGYTGLHIPVSMTLGAGFTLPADRTIALGVAAPSIVTGSIALGINGNQSPAWSATSDKPWLTLQAASSAGPTTLTYSIDTTKLADLQNYAPATASVTFKAAGMGDAVHKVTVKKTLPQVTGLTPNPILAGNPTEVHVRGRGFAQLSGISAFKIANVQATQGSIVSDTEAVITLSLPNVGSYALSLPASPGTTIAQPTLNVMNATDMSAALIDSAGEKSVLLFSASRNALYLIDQTNRKLLRYRLTGSTWINDKSLPVDAGVGIGMSLDDQILYTTNSGSVVEERDPETLVVKASYKDDSLATYIQPHYGQALPITNDGRIWFSRAQSSELRYFDTVSKKFASAEMQNYAMTNASYAVSRDGSRMFANASPERGGTDYALRYDPATGQFDRAANMPHFGQTGTSLSGDGKYVATDGNKVYESASYRLVGSLPNGTGGGYYNSTLLSPDGSRIYTPGYDLSSVSGSLSHNLVRIDVIDTNSMTKIGEIALPPGVAVCGSDIVNCNLTGLLTMSPLGETIFWAGYSKIAVIPVPKAFRPAASATRFRLRH
ncbi:hypothetical protein GTP81_27795 [Rugamonas sp. FT107W]|uniref:IPT/TIG domain-containing protein n=1 Tax=Duganella vulcania TaxID=2692166 RepID=A0A845HT11_9BURK|nr:BACON domain-containing protein [Duganella vulcania]MYN20549.1 hypothetical protein [Duganella vulcania]